MKCIFGLRCRVLSSLVCSLLLLGGLLGGCATSAPEENQLERRAAERWQALLSDDIEAAYEYLSPGYRSSVSYVQYIRALLSKQVGWTDARYIESDCAETSCKVKISLDYSVYGAVPGVRSFDGTQVIEESWVLADRTWYFVPRQ